MRKLLIVLMWVPIVGGLITLLALGIGWGLLSHWMPGLADMLTEDPFRPDVCNQVVAAVKNGTLMPNPTGELLLPPNLAPAARYGRAYVTRKKGLLLILFPKWEGRAGDLNGYLYCSRPLTKSDTQLTDTSGTQPAIDARIPLFSRPVEIGIERKLSTNWYYVSSNLD